MNSSRTRGVKTGVIPRSSGEDAYKSKYWPNLNGVMDESAVLAAPWGSSAVPQSERETELLDIIGAYDLLLLQGLTDNGALKRLGLNRSRDELVQELDSETARRLSLQLPSRVADNRPGKSRS